MRKCRICNIELTNENTHNYTTKQHRICKECERKRKNDKNYKDKIALIKEYGGKCVCCGEFEPIFLTIDHINEDGAKHRKENGIYAGASFYRWLKQQGYPKDNYQVLCFNCNFAKHVLGKCPHQLPPAGGAPPPPPPPAK
jgi:hypothetical protein